MGDPHSAPLNCAAAASRQRSSVDESVNPTEIEAECLVEIDNCPKLKRILQEWEKRFEVASLRIEKKSTRSFNAKSELYQLIGFYFVFQGVVLTAVAQTNLIHCKQSWGPASLSLLASVATISSVYNKLINYSRLRQALEDETTDSKDLQFRIWDLKKKGTSFRFPEAKEKGKTSQGLEPFHFRAVVAALIIFSVIILASCFAILCQHSNIVPTAAPN